MANKTQNIENLEKELNTFAKPKAEAKKTSPKKSGTKSKKTTIEKKKGVIILSKGKRKEAIARATLTSGSGKIRVNGINVDLMKPKALRELVLEPVKLSNETKELASTFDIDINVCGGGSSGQAQAARSDIAKALTEASKGSELKSAYLQYDRSLLADDYRRVEPKKFKGPKARARFQKSYR